MGTIDNMGVSLQGIDREGEASLGHEEGGAIYQPGFYGREGGIGKRQDGLVEERPLYRRGARGDRG